MGQHDITTGKIAKNFLKFITIFLNNFEYIIGFFRQIDLDLHPHLIPFGSAFFVHLENTVQHTSEHRDRRRGESSFLCCPYYFGKSLFPRAS